MTSLEYRVLSLFTTLTTQCASETSCSVHVTALCISNQNCESSDKRSPDILRQRLWLSLCRKYQKWNVQTYQVFILHDNKVLRSRMISPVNGQKLASQFQWFGLCHNKKKYLDQMDCTDLNSKMS